MKRDIKITVSGLAGVGKTTVAMLLKKALDNIFVKDVDIILTDPDPPISTKEFERRLLSIIFSEDETTITIETQNLNKTIQHGE